MDEGNPFTVAADRRLAERTLEKLADLIDPSGFHALAHYMESWSLSIDPTCRNVSGCQNVFECSECRCRAELVTEVCNEYGEPFHVPLMPSFCPNCGVRVVGR